MIHLGVAFWLTWAVVLLAQNFSFTFVSRARNSGSLSRHIKASLMSNGVWFLSQIFAINTITAIITGKLGIGLAVLAGLFYTAFTVVGSILAHYISLKTEKGSGAVGANKKFAQIPVEEWQLMKNDWNRVVNGIHA